MKKITTIGIALLLLAGGAAAENLVLGEEQGLSEKIEVLNYDGKEKSVKVRTDSEISQRPFSTFSESIQKLILAWAADETFESSSGLRVRIKEVSESRSVDKKSADERTNGDIERVFYEVELENWGDVPVDDVTVQAIVFYEQIEGKSEKKVRSASSEKLTIFPGSKKTFKSSPLEIRDLVTRYENYFDDDSAQSSTYIEDDLKGVIVILKRTDRNGRVITRELKDGRPPKPKEREEYREIE